jgi:hypothetical protein
MVNYVYCQKCGKVTDEFETECGWCQKDKAEIEKQFEAWYNGYMSPFTLVSEWYLLDLALHNEEDDLHQYREKMVNWLKAAFEAGYKVNKHGC